MADQENREDALERLFREKAQEYDISYREEDWQELEGRLDSLDHQHKQRIRRRLIAAAVALVISVLAYFVFQNQQQINQLNERLSSNQNETPTVERPKDSGHLQDTNSNQGSPSGLARNEDGQVPKVESANPNRERQLNKQDTSEADQVDDKQEAGSQTQRYASYSFVRQPLPATPEVGEAHTPPAQAGATSLAKVELPNQQGIAPPEKRRNHALQAVRTPSTRNRSPLSLGLVLGPDLSTAGGIDHFYNPGYKIGFTLDYNISPRLALTSGIIRTRTRYTASGGEYRAPAGYWTNGITPDRTKANCVLLDIPLSLKYSFMQFLNSRLYATAGISSYIMLDEQYRFEYESEYYQSNLKQSWKEKTGTRHWMSNASFSLGYEFDLAGNWSLRAEPFLKVPLKEIGWGNVNLYSMGTIVSLNFNLPGKP